MVVVDSEKCVQCGLCVKTCHEHCMTLAPAGVAIDYEYCSTCTQCIAVCPEQALTWDGVPPVPFDKTRLPSPEQLDELFKERRTMRSFKRDKIERALVEEIAGYGIDAPTNNYHLRAILVDDEQLIEALDGVVLQFARRIYRLLYRTRLAYSLIRRIAPASEMHLARPKLEAVLARGYAFHQPPAIVFIVGDKRVALSRESAQYALANIMYYAQAKGLGSCLWGNAQLVLDRNRAARRWLGLAKDERIFGALALGHAAVRFANKVAGKVLDMQWRP
jgi:NAD-dependent dihydropyrimidine dehydrogenase PreA subunit/nitroreductase